MRICVFVRVFWPGGVQSIAFGEAKSLEDRGHKVDLVFLRDSNRGEHPWSYMHPYRILYDSNINKRLLHKIFWSITKKYAPERGEDATVDLDLIKEFEKQREKYDVVIYYDQLSAFYANYGSKLHGDRYIVNIMETFYKKKGVIPQYLERRALKNASAILTIGKLNADILKEKGFHDVFLLYPGTTNVKELPEFETRDNKIISVTMWDTGRHPENFIEIAKNIKNGKIYLIGDWTNKVFYLDFIELIKFNGLENRIIVVGKVSRTELEKYYKTAKVMIRFGYNEAGPGMGTLEAISYGLPLIINNQIGIKDVTESIKTNSFYVVNEKDVKSITSIIKLLLDDRNVWKTKSMESLRIADMLSWENHGKNLENIITNIK